MYWQNTQDIKQLHNYVLGRYVSRNCAQQTCETLTLVNGSLQRKIHVNSVNDACPVVNTWNTLR